MLAITYALVSAVLYGVSDFLSGVQSRRRHFLVVAAVAQTFSATCLTALALAQGSPPTRQAVVWGLAATVGHVFGTLMLMRGLAAGAMHVAGPLSAVCAAGLPVLLGVALGERPTPIALVGIALALPAVWAVAAGEGGGPSGKSGAQTGDGSGGASLAGSGTGTPTASHDDRAGVRDGLLAGVGFAVYFVALAHAGAGAGSWPVAVCQLGSLVAMWAIVLQQRAHRRPDGGVRAALPAWSVGLTGAFGALTYFLASRAGGGRLTIVPVVASLYPAFTVLLAMAVLGERASRTQVVGLLGCAAAVGLIAAG
ncbi:EamA family transporter [Arsenicicoccus dermatophilus]|uniref:EamA family transporter n=1 Tax=Arsenicicoccus dermatophilus TaxID=1076331 RepID=UPI003916D870